MSIADFFQKTKTFGDTLATIGQPLSDCELVNYILARLGSEYDPLITSITTQIDRMNIQEVYGHLLNFMLCPERLHTTLDFTSAPPTLFQSFYTS